MFETKVFNCLTTSTVITGQFSTRIYPSVLPQQTAYPALTYVRVSCNYENDFQGSCTLENPVLAVDVWAGTYKQAKELAKNVQDAISSASDFKSIRIGMSDFYEDETSIYRITMDFSCWNGE